LLHRHIWVVALWTGLFGVGSYALAADAPEQTQNPTALLEQGLNQFEKGNHAAAAQTLRGIDGARLTPDQRVRLHETLAQIQKREEFAGDPATLLARGAEAEKLGDLLRATAFYEAVGRHAQATDSQKLIAGTNLVAVRRRQGPELSRVRALIDQAVADADAGRYDEADRKVREISGASASLGWYDVGRLDRLKLVLAERQPTSAPAPGPNAVASASASMVLGAQPQKSGEASGDVMSQVVALHIQEQLAIARKAEQGKQYDLAAKSYQEVLKVDPENEQAKQGLEAARMKADVSMAPASVLDTQSDIVRLNIQRIKAEFGDLMERASSLNTQRNFPAAKGAVQQARIILDRDNRYLPSDDRAQMRQQASELSAEIDRGQAVAADTATKMLEAEKAKDATVSRINAMAKNDRQVQELLHRARELRKEQRYERALQLVDQALFLDPQNFAAQAMKEMIEDSHLYVQHKKLNRELDYMIRRTSIQNAESRNPYTDLMTYPPDWPELTQRRLAGDDLTADSEINRRVELKLKEPVPISFDNNTLFNVIDYLRNTTGLNIYVNWTALQNAGVEQDYPITLQLANVSAAQALELVLQEASAGNELDPISYAVHEGLVKISTDRELKRTTVTSRIYDIRDLLVQVANFTNAPTFDLSSALSSSGSTGGSGGGGGGGSSGSSLFSGTGTDTQDDESDVGREDLIFRIIDLVQGIGRPEEWAAFGGDISSVSELNGNLIVRTTPSNHREIISLLQSLRETRAMQISVEARFLLVDQNFLEEIGMDVDMQIGKDDDQSGFTAVKIAQDSFGVAARPSTGITGSFGAIGLGNAGLGAFSDFAGVGGTQRSMDVAFSYLSDFQVSVIIRASQNTRRAVSVTAPRITFFNGQRAFITVARQISFVSALEAVPDSDFFNPTLSVTQSGVVLDVEGTISADRRYVTMTIQPSLATVIDIRRVQFFEERNSNSNNNNNNNNNNDGPTILSGTIEAPELELTNLRTTVSVPDKGTLMLGGQRLVGEIEVEAGVPVLSKLPYINRLFTNRSKIKDERTLLILIKPTIIIQTEEEDLNYPGLRQDPRTYNLGSRRFD